MLSGFVGTHIHYPQTDMIAAIASSFRNGLHDAHSDQLPFLG